MIIYMDRLLPPANFLLLFVNVFPRSTSNSEMPTAEGKYLFSFCFFIISPRLDLNKIFAFLRMRLPCIPISYSFAGILSVNITKPSLGFQMIFLLSLRELEN